MQRGDSLLLMRPTDIPFHAYAPLPQPVAVHDSGAGWQPADYVRGSYDEAAVALVKVCSAV